MDWSQQYVNSEGVKPPSHFQYGASVQFLPLTATATAEHGVSLLLIKSTLN